MRKSKLCPDNRTKQEIDYFIAGLDMETSRAESAETTQKIHNEYSNVFTAHFLYRSRMI